MLRHEVSWVGRTPHLHESHLLAQLHLLQPEGADVKMSDPANSSPLEEVEMGEA